MANIRILIADDHSAIRSGVKHILASEFANIEFGESTTAAEVLNRLKNEVWDLLILDIDMPGRNGLEILQQLKAEKNFLPVLVFSMHSEDQIAMRALKLGAWGYLSKDAADTELVDAIRRILSGRKYISANLAELMALQLENPFDKPLHEQLSDREFQTLLLMASGKPVSEIALDLSLSISTISTYRSRILEKMGMLNNAQLTRYAIENNLL